MVLQSDLLEPGEEVFTHLYDEDPINRGFRNRLDWNVRYQVYVWVDKRIREELGRVAHHTYVSQEPS